MTRLGSIVALCCVLVFWACDPSVPGGPRPNILLLSVDTLRADHLGCYGNAMWGQSPTPTIDRLARGGVLFERCFAPRGQTHPSVASMLTGKYPLAHHLRENAFWLAETNTTFIERLRNAGYRTAGFASNLYKEQNPLEKGTPPNWWTRGLDSYGDGYGDRFWYESVGKGLQDQWGWDQRVEEQTVAWIDRFDAAGGSPFFLWTHFYDPHRAYLPNDACPDYYPEYEGPMKPAVKEVDGKPVDLVTKTIDAATQSGRPMAPEDHREVLSIYDGTVFVVDQRFERILAALERKGMLENTWILFVADHGAELGDHRHYYYHSASIYDSVLHIPLIVTGPGAPGGARVTSLVQNLDIAPTILELARVDYVPDPGVEGQSLLDVIMGGKEKIDRDFAFAEWQYHIYSISDGDFKYIFNPGGVCPMKSPFKEIGRAFEYDEEELYDLQNDPGETRNLADLKKKKASEMRQKLLLWLRLDNHDLSGRLSNLLPGSNEAVQSLGYTGAGPRAKDILIKKKKPR